MDIHNFLEHRKEVLKSVRSGNWSSSEARRTLLSITTRLTYLNITPNKTKRTKNISQIKFQVPESCQVLIGTLLAICEAHYQLNKDNNDEPLIRQIKEYKRINRYMGKEIETYFLKGILVLDLQINPIFKLLPC